MNGIYLFGVNTTPATEKTLYFFYIRFFLYHSILAVKNILET